MELATLWLGFSVVMIPMLIAACVLENREERRNNNG